MRAISNSTWASGKGLNTARALSILDDVHAVVLGFSGRNLLPLLHTIRSPKIELKWTEVGENARTNITICDKYGELVGHLQTQGFSIDPNVDIPKIQKAIEETVVSGDVAIVSGSLPPGLDKESYRPIIEQLKKIGAFVILDSSEDCLIQGIKSSPDLIKPNFDEFKVLTGNSELNPEDLADVLSEMKKLRETTDIGTIAVTLGQRGTLVFQKGSDKAFYSNVRLSEEYKSVNALGCGDSFVGGFAYGLLKNESIEETIRSAVSLATANLFQDGPGCIDRSMFLALRNRVEITRI